MAIFAGIVFDPGSLVAWLIVGLISGWVSSKVMEAPSYGAVGDVFLGAAGGLVGGFLFGLLWQWEFAFLGGILVAFVGACLFIAGARVVAAVRTP